MITTTPVEYVCSGCRGKVSAAEPVCSACGRIQPERDSDMFAVFGLPRRLLIDATALEKQFYRLSRKLHPDRFSRASAEEKALSLRKTSQLNDAFRTLADPVSRAEYLLELEGVRQREQRRGDANGENQGVPPELLEEAFELNMALEEARAGGADDPETRAQLEEARETFAARMQESTEELHELFAEWDRSLESGTGDREVLERIGSLLDRRRYLRNLLREVTAVLNPSEG